MAGTCARLTLVEGADGTEETFVSGVGAGVGGSTSFGRSDGAVIVGTTGAVAAFDKGRGPLVP